MKSRIWVCLLSALVGWSTAVLRADVRCAVCLRFLEEGETYATAVDQVESTPCSICSACSILPMRCFLCALPIKDNPRSLSDQRHYCSRDAKAAVFDASEVRRICLETRTLMDRPLARFMALPGANVEWTVEDVSHRTQALATNPTRCSLAGVRYSIQVSDAGALRHYFAIVNGLPKDWISSATAHLYAHAWFMEHVPEARRIRATTVEASCDLIALKCLAAWGQKGEAQRLQRNSQAEGQLEVLIEADRSYELFRILEWIKFGADDHLIAGDPDRVRRLDEKLQPVNRQPTRVIPPPPAPVQAPEELILRSLVGTGNRRLALINDATLAVGEEGRVHVGASVVRVRCLEIREDAVVVQVEGEPAKRELKLHLSDQPR